LFAALSIFNLAFVERSLVEPSLSKIFKLFSRSDFVSKFEVNFKQLQFF
jgi:hypothetical protein